MKKMKALIMSMVICITAIAVRSVPIAAQSESDASGSVGLESEVLIDFENAKETLKSVRLDGINKAVLCDDDSYVTQGERCLHLCPEMEEIEEGAYYADSSIVLYPKKAVYSDVEYICIDVYNPKDKNQTAILGFTGIFEEYVIEPGKNTLWLYIDRARLEYANKGQIVDLFLRFEGGSRETGALDVYIDNFRCYYAKTDYKKYANDFTQNVWYSFENEGDLANIQYHGTKMSDFSQPLFHINHDIRYIRNGTGSLRVDFRNMQNGAQDTRMFRTADGKLGDLNQYLDDLGGYYIGFPIYNANDFDIACTVQIFSNYNDENITLSGTIPAGSWSDADFAMSLEDMEEAFTGSGFDIMTIAFLFDGMPDGGTVYLDSIGVYPLE